MNERFDLSAVWTLGRSAHHATVPPNADHQFSNSHCRRTRRTCGTWGCMPSIRPTQSGPPVTVAVAAMGTRKIASLAIGKAADHRRDGKRATLHTLRTGDRTQDDLRPEISVESLPTSSGFPPFS